MTEKQIYDKIIATIKECGLDHHLEYYFKKACDHYKESKDLNKTLNYIKNIWR